MTVLLIGDLWHFDRNAGFVGTDAKIHKLDCRICVLKSSLWHHLLVPSEQNCKLITSEQNRALLTVCDDYSVVEESCMHAGAPDVSDTSGAPACIHLASA